MRKGYWIYLILIFGILGLLLTPSCVKKTSVIPDGMEKVMAQPELEPSEDICKEKPAEMKVEEPDMGLAVDEGEMGLGIKEDVLFDFDSSDLTAEAQEILKTKVDYMNENPDLKATIEGHCDERGTNEYNLALGDRRAQSAKNFMTDMGISPDRLTTISYGEERPIDDGHDEIAWAKNRRVHFVFE